MVVVVTGFGASNGNCPVVSSCLGGTALICGGGGA